LSILIQKIAKKLFLRIVKKMGGFNSLQP